MAAPTLEARAHSGPSYTTLLDSTVPKALVWDGEAAVGRWRARKPELTADCQAFRGVLGSKVIICKPADPEAKGMLERLHDYLERSFLPGKDVYVADRLQRPADRVLRQGQRSEDAGSGLHAG